MARNLRFVPLTLGLILAALLGACATRTPEAPMQVTQTGVAARPAAEEREPITGSRFSSRSTDRMVRQVGAAGAKEMDRNRPPEPGPQFR